MTGPSLCGQFQRVVGTLHVDGKNLVQGRYIIGNARQVHDALHAF